MVNGTWSWQLEIEFLGGRQAPGRCCIPARGRLLSVRGLYCCVYVREIKVTLASWIEDHVTHRRHKIVRGNPQ